MAKFVLYKNEGKIYRLEAELPPSDAYTVFEFNAENPEDLIYDGTQIRLKTQDEKLQELKAQKLSELKTYVASLLSQTDWVIIKLQSMKEEGWSVNEIQVEVQKYQPILEKRKRIREWNKQTEQAIQNAKTIEELEAIKIEFEG